MAINAIMRAALKALSYPDLDIKKNYKLQRSVDTLAHFHYLKPFYKAWDHTCLLYTSGPLFYSLYLL